MGGSLITLGARSALQGNHGMREGGGGHGYGPARPAGNGARHAGGASPGATCPDKLKLGAREPWEEVDGEKVEGKAAAVESGQGPAWTRGKKLLFWVVGGGMGRVSRVCDFLAWST